MAIQFWDPPKTCLVCGTTEEKPDVCFPNINAVWGRQAKLFGKIYRNEGWLIQRIDCLMFITIRDINQYWLLKSCHKYCHRVFACVRVHAFAPALAFMRRPLLRLQPGGRREVPPGIQSPDGTCAYRWRHRRGEQVGCACRHL